jgi:hypothetical protein
MNNNNESLESIFVIASMCIMCLASVVGGYLLQYLHINPDVTPTATIAAPASIPVSLNSAIVCTGSPGGHVNVRADAGDAYPEVGALNEGQSLQIKNDASPRTAVNGSTWIEVTSPLSGWVDQSHICYQNEP